MKLQISTKAKWPMVNLDEGIGEGIAEQNSKRQL
jgi:hypothetical protein